MFTIYSKDACIYCVRAAAMLKTRGLEYEEFKLGKDYTLDYFLEHVVPTDGQRTFPQVFHGNKYIGGSDQLSAYLEEATGGSDTP